MTHLSREQCEAGLDRIRAAPRDEGVLHLVVRRPGVNAREVVEEGQLDVVEGLVGDTWRMRASPRMPDGLPHPDMQLNVMGVRVIDLLAQSRERWPLAGDQLYVDLDLSEANLPPGTRLAVGSAEIEVTDVPHLGCAKFVERFGLEAMKFVNSPVGRQLRLRGLNARVLTPGTIRPGDPVRKLG